MVERYMSVELAGSSGLHEGSGYSIGTFEGPFTGTVIVPGVPLGVTDEHGRYVPREIVADDLGDEQISAAIESSFVEVEEGNLVEGTVVKVDREEVLVDLGFKSEGVIPLRELSIRNDVLPGD
ncbi:30S ribosomal protein S1, partial [mine drainage metagenome]